MVDRVVVRYDEDGVPNRYTITDSDVSYEFLHKKSGLWLRTHTLKLNVCYGVFLAEHKEKLA